MTGNNLSPSDPILLLAQKAIATHFHLCSASSAMAKYRRAKQTMMVEAYFAKQVEVARELAK